MHAVLYHANGGEALTHVLKLYRKLADFHPTLTRNSQIAPLAEFASKPGRPLVVEVVIEIGTLRSEYGGGIEDLLSQIESVLEEPDFYDGWTAQDNFELTRLALPSQLSFYEVNKIKEFDENGGWREIFKFAPFDPA